MSDRTSEVNLVDADKLIINPATAEGQAAIIAAIENLSA